MLGNLRVTFEDSEGLAYALLPAGAGFGIGLVCLEILWQEFPLVYSGG